MVDAGGVGVAGYVHWKTQSNTLGNHSGPVAFNEDETAQKDVKSSQANNKRRREAQHARVATPRNVLTEDNLTAHQRGGEFTTQLDSLASQNQHVLPVAKTRSLFGTDSGHADESTMVSMPADASHSVSAEYRSHRDDRDGEYQKSTVVTRSCQGIKDQSSLAQESNTQSAVQTAFQSESHVNRVQALGMSASYPSTTAGEDDSDSTSFAPFQHFGAAARTHRSELSLQVRADNGPSKQKTENTSQRPQQLVTLPPQGSRTDSIGLNRAADNIRTLQGYTIEDTVSRSALRLPAKQVLKQERNSTRASNAVSPPTQSQMGSHPQIDEDSDYHVHEDDGDDYRSDNLGADGLPEKDYSNAELKEMSFERLREEPPDFNPRATHYDLPAAQAGAPLADRLAHVKQLDRREQSTFLATLDLQDWEEAGDWFLDQFSAVIGAFRDARKQKRRLAAEVEEKIYGRHQAVEAKKRSIDEALTEMKSSGATILNGTPNKKRRG